MGPLMKSDGKRVVSLVPGDWSCRDCQAKGSFGMSKPNNIPSRKYWLPMWESRFSHFGSAGSFGGRLGLKAVWHAVQAMPTLYGGSTLLASSRYLSTDHFFASKSLFLKSCRPTTPLEKPKTSGSQVSVPSFIRSIIRPYWSGFSAGTQSGSLMRPIFSHRSERGTVCSIRNRSIRAVSTFSFLLVSLAISRQKPGLSAPHHQCHVSMPSPTFLGSAP